jgi:hypothetical protein
VSKNDGESCSAVAVSILPRSYTDVLERIFEK